MPTCVAAAHPEPGAPARPAFTVSDIFEAARDHIARAPYLMHVKKTIAQIALCRSGAYGHHKLACTCGYCEWLPRGCGNRHCPSCGHTRAADWVEEREVLLLPVPYYQCVFTLPPAMVSLALENPKLVYNALFHAVRDTLDAMAETHLQGAVPQILLALHTWNSAMDYHVHIHVLISAGGYHEASKTWVTAKHDNFLFPIGAMRKLFRGKFMARLKKLQNLLSMKSPSNRPFNQPACWDALVSTLYREKWFVYCAPTVAGPRELLRYLGQYLQKPGIGNRRIVSVANGRVRFTCKDRKKRISKAGSYERNVSVEEFSDLFARHVLPLRMRRTRLAGLWSPPKRELHEAAWNAIRASAALPQLRDADPDLPPRAPVPCPQCKVGTLVYVETDLLFPRWTTWLDPPPT